MQIEMVAIESLTPDPKNARTHEKGIPELAKSLVEFGQRKPLVVWQDTVVAGNGLLEAAISLGWSEIAIARTPDDWTHDRAQAFALADNKTAELSGWDTLVLEDIRFDLDKIGWDLEEFGFDPLPTIAKFEDVDPDDVPEVPVRPTAKLGDLYKLGNHRLLCGDCREPSDVNRLIGNRVVNVAFTSPPYAEQRKYDETSGFKPIPPAEYVPWFEAVAFNVASHLANDGSWFVNIKEHADDGQRVLYVKDLTLAHVREWGWRFIDELAWVHNAVPGGWPNRFKNGWEPVFQFSRAKEIKFRPESVAKETDSAFTYSPDNPKSKTGFISLKGRPDIYRPGLARPSNVLNIGSETGMTEEHSAPFPVALPEFFINAYSDEGDNIYDPFVGSGSTLIACERRGRCGFGMEISPRYVDVIIKRWENLTGQKARKLK